MLPLNLRFTDDRAFDDVAFFFTGNHVSERNIGYGQLGIEKLNSRFSPGATTPAIELFEQPFFFFSYLYRRRI